VRDEQHEWNGCKCRKCGVTREHNWLVVGSKCIEKCSFCGKERNIVHKWNGCTCEKCGATRYEGHNWLLAQNKCAEKCSICGEVRVVSDNFRPVSHNFEPISDNFKPVSDMCGHNLVSIGGCRKKCSLCGKMTYDHDYVSVESGSWCNDCSFKFNFRCTKCGHTAVHWGNPGGEEDTRQYGFG
jgi:hypothetical protein